MICKATRPIFSLILLLVTSCVSLEDKSSQSGLALEYQNFIPARIAVLPTKLWPQASVYDGFLATNLSDSQIVAFCRLVDEFVIKSFTNQPFIKGYTPNLVSNFLKSNNKQEQLDKLLGFWQVKDKKFYVNPLEIYNRSVFLDNNWLLWLHELSLNVNYADAVFIPFLLHAREEKSDVRGILHSVRSLRIALFLIDTNNGKVVWENEVGADFAAKDFVNLTKKSYPEYPDWQIVKDRVFLNTLWLDFPGLTSTTWDER